MKNPENQSIRSDYEMEMLCTVQYLITLRMQKSTQSEMSKKLGVSMRNIANFENYRTFSGYLIWGYEKLLK